MLATTTDADPTRENYFLWDSAVMFQMKANTQYYIAVDEPAGAFGLGAFYPLHVWAFLPLGEEVEFNDDVATANAVPFLNLGGGTRWGRISGSLPTLDTTDIVTFTKNDAGGTNGRYLNVQLQAIDVGSLLDARVTVYGADGTTVLADSSDHPLTGSPDPHIVDFVMPDEDRIYVRLDAENADPNDFAKSWFLSVYVTDAPLN